MVFDRPKRSGGGRPAPATQRPGASTQRPQRGGEGRQGRGRGQGHGGNRGGRGGNGPEPPSPWLIDPVVEPDATASFVEYLRWMRPYQGDDPYRDPKKVQLLQLAEENAYYRDRLTQLTQRTSLIANAQQGRTFPVNCLWRVRVGGHRGPESILLPAFDATGMPYIPSSTLRGAARTQAIRATIAAENLSWKKAEEQVSRQYFGYLDSKKASERAGKVTFLDAYPLPQQSGNGGGLAVDMANNIWSWDAAGQDLLYFPNPNAFFSLLEATFLIGICPAQDCDAAILEQVQAWLLAGLQAGIGAQVNTGYGSLVQSGASSPRNQFFEIEFALEGQLIHGRQRFTQWNWNDRRQEWQMRGKADAEVRPVAFKSMLRYWFRVFALGVLPSRAVQQLEAQLFGAINPTQKRGWLTVQIADGRVVQREARPNRDGQRDPCGEQSGRLLLAYSSECPSSSEDAVATLMKTLTWMMFHLGGIGQGARRPRYSRKTRERAPWWRGSTLFPEAQEQFWNLPDSAVEFRKLFRRRLRSFYEALQVVANHPINATQPLRIGRVQRDQWTEAVDANCRIIVCAGEEEFGKPYALAQLHDPELKVRNRQGQPDYDGNLCGQVRGGVKPSPVWIADLEEYQVITVFGATQNPRKQYIANLKQRTAPNNFAQIWPFT